MKFNRQVCTTIEQSNRLLKLGLNPETADACFFRSTYEDLENTYTRLFVDDYILNALEDGDNIPAWSLHRLIDLMPEYIHFDDFEDSKYYLTLRPYCLLKVSYKQDSGNWLYGSESSNLFDAIIDVIEHLILGKHFDKQYLNQ